VSCVAVLIHQVLALCCSATGFCYAFLLVTWTSSEKNAAWKRAWPDYSSVANIVIFMVTSILQVRAVSRAYSESGTPNALGLGASCCQATSPLKQGFIIFTDRYFTAVGLAERLLAMKHHLVGTIKVDRGVAAEKMWPSDAKYPRWTATFMRYWRDPRIMLQSWMDRGQVHMYGVCQDSNVVVVIAFV
jgi:hypothetical protein